MRTALVSLAVLMAAAPGRGGAAWPIKPFESISKYRSRHPVDVLVQAKLRERGIRPARVCSDEVFLRRVYLDVIGTLPESADVRAFLQGRRPNRRRLLIDALLKREEFADYWSMKWCDLLRVKAEFPINLWPNAVQAYHRWIHDAIRHNMPYDQFVRALLTSSGSNFRVPPVNFYRAIQGHEPSAIANAAALTFMGTRLAGWPKAEREGFTAFFSRVAYKGTAEWKEEIVYLDPAPTTPLDAVFPDGVSVQIPPGSDPRQVFADWLLKPGNPWFARSIANRVWAWLMGRGIIHEPDDIRPDNRAVNPKLLAFLEKELVRSKYDLRHLFRVILTSRTYQQSPVPASAHPEAEALFAHYKVRRIDAEVLADALCWLAGDGASYMSMIPEPFTYVPEHQRSIMLADGSITSQFLEMFGRPSRDTGLEAERRNNPTDAQILHLLNSTNVQRRLQRSKRLRLVVRAARGNREKAIRGLYVTILSRPPIRAEMTAAEEYFTKSGFGQGAADLAWALVNTKEFLYRH